MCRHITIKRRHKASQMAILLTDATLATMVGGYGLIRDAAMALDGGQIAWIGATSPSIE